MGLKSQVYCSSYPYTDDLDLERTLCLCTLRYTPAKPSNSQTQKNKTRQKKNPFSSLELRTSRLYDFCFLFDPVKLSRPSFWNSHSTLKKKKKKFEGVCVCVFIDSSLD